MRDDTSAEEEDQGRTIYTCEWCGSHDFYVEHAYTTTTYFSDTIGCQCGEGPEGIAAQRCYHIIELWHAAGDLGENHRWSEEDDERIDMLEEEEDNLEIFCTQCLEEQEEVDWEVEILETKIDEDGHEFWVFCTECSREIEFGWSHPDRGGRIWPAESNDFNPWKSWPEPRHRDAWAEKGWLRPDFK